MTLAEPSSAQPAASPRWLSIVGIGEDGIEALTPPARAAVAAAELVFGGARHLSLAAAWIRGRAHAWPVPFERSLREVLAERGRPVCVLASGDPFCHGVGSLLAQHVSRAEVRVFPAPSAFSLAAARLLWPLARTVQLSLCGRSLDHVRPHLQPGARLLVLSADHTAPAALAALLSGSGFGASRLTVLEALAGPRERIRSARADAFELGHIDPLNTVAIEVVAGAGARCLPRAAGLADELFEHDGQLTKRELRALTLSALAPRRGELLWDVGAGSGSVGIEWLLADASLQAVAIERRPERAAAIERNAAAFGVPHLQLLRATAPAAFAGLATPDAVFVGGGGGTPGLLEAVQQALRRGGRLVVNAVSLETESVLLAGHARSGGALTRIAVAHAVPIGRGAAPMTGWRPAYPITQWTWEKP